MAPPLLILAVQCSSIVWLTGVVPTMWRPGCGEVECPVREGADHERPPADLAQDAPERIVDAEQGIVSLLAAGMERLIFAKTLR
jgi:hypothetical protein